MNSQHALAQQTFYVAIRIVYFKTATHFVDVLRHFVIFKSKSLR